MKTFSPLIDEDTIHLCTKKYSSYFQLFLEMLYKKKKHLKYVLKNHFVFKTNSRRTVFSMKFAKENYFLFLIRDNCCLRIDSKPTLKLPQNLCDENQLAINFMSIRADFYNSTRDITYI